MQFLLFLRYILRFFFQFFKHFKIKMEQQVAVKLKFYSLLTTLSGIPNATLDNAWVRHQVSK